MKLSWSTFEIHPRVPFRIARSSTTAYTRTLVHLRDEGGAEGWGEAAPNTFYREDERTVHAALLALEPVLRDVGGVGTLEEVEALEDALRDTLPGDASARAAVSAAAHDMLGRRLGRPLFDVLGLNPNTAPPTSFTIAIPPDADELVRRVEEARDYPILKVKLGTERDEWIARTVRRAAPRATLRADANAAWDLARARTMAALLADLGFELLEQPLAPPDVDGARRLREGAPIRIVADESCIDSRDIPRLHRAADGINVKLSKCGGLAEARRMVRAAHAAGMTVMLGCMIESSLGITAAAHLAPLVDHADLDGAALLADDPFQGATIENGMIRLPAGPGLGVERGARPA